MLDVQLIIERLFTGPTGPTGPLGDDWPKVLK